ncbi:MAG: fimbria/pilus periplasmic chaperone [Methylotetracoccus sp.]
MYRARGLLTIALALASLGLGVCEVYAAQVSVSPTSVELSAKRTSATVTLRNSSGESVVMQSSVATWVRQAGEDQHKPTTDLIATPPIFTIPPNGTQIVRVGFRRPVDPRKELAYRLFLQEVPPEKPLDRSGVRLALKMILPVMVEAANPSPPRPSWSGARRSDGSIEVTLFNAGGTHVSVQELKIGAIKGVPTPRSQPAAPSVLPGSRQTWVFSPSAGDSSARTVHVKALSSVGPLETDVALPAR